jgi:deferrochelatase/peroxidase EfeB
MTKIRAADVQGNVLNGYGSRFNHARHFALGIGRDDAARRFLGALLDGRDDGLTITSGARWPKDEKPKSCLNIGFTWQGLKALGVPAEVLAAFPTAFREGPAFRARTSVRDERHVGLGDVRESAPELWTMGGPRNPEVHVLVSLYASGEGRLDDVSDRLHAAFGMYLLRRHWDCHAQALGKEGRVHFGFRDGIGQPRIEGGHGNTREDMQPDMPAGDLLLGCDYVNSFRGNFAGDLPRALADNATYGAFRVLSQDVARFERLLAAWHEETGLSREAVAAKLVGRWRNGVPLVLSPETGEPEPPVRDRDLDAFDYVAQPGEPGYDDSDGRRCPIGAHIRRMNPRGALVMGIPHSRRIVRRGMPYGPERNGAADDGADRGLVGYFLCGDLETQWEFLQRVYVNDDIATFGIRGTREPIGGTQPVDGGMFVIPTPDGEDDHKLGGLASLVRTRGSVYCLLPGIGGLRYLAELGA